MQIGRGRDAACSSAELLNSNPCTPHEGRGVIEAIAIVISLIGPRTGPSRVVRPLSLAPFLRRIARALWCSLNHAPICITVTDRSARPL
jgi:hypothetical protein